MEAEMAGETACVFDGDSSGQDTPVGFRDTPGQWYTANHRKRAALSQLEGEPTQRDSQETQEATEVTTQPQEKLAPVFVIATPSQEDHEADNEVDEEETQIRMTNSEEQDAPKPIRKIFEEAVPLPIRSGSLSNVPMGDSDNDGDSDMSDDMLDQDGSIGGLSSIAASFQHRDQKAEVVKKKLYKPNTSFRSSSTVSTCDDSESSGGETEIEGEPNEESPGKGKTLPTPRHLKKGTSSLTNEDGSPSEVTSMKQSLSTPKKTQLSSLPSPVLKRDHSEDSDSDRANVKRSRHSDGGSSSRNLDEEDLVEQELNDEDLKHQLAARSPSRDNTEDPAADIIQPLAECIEKDVTQPFDILPVVEEPPASLTTPPSKRKKPVSSHKRNHTARSRSVTDNASAESQVEAGSIRVILTGLEPTAAIRKKIKSIPGAVYESTIEKATHVIAPQNQLKRTVKLLCGISCCKHILDQRWLDESAQVRAAVDEQANCLRDEEAEDKWQFDLRSTMYEAPMEQRQRLFADFSVFITNHKSVLPPVKDLLKIVECAGGKASSKGKPSANDLVITSETALDVATVRKQLTNANPERIYSSELILSGILQQRVELDKNRLELPAIGKTWATKRRK